jgi:(E)-4-hydroxy-3-methylbut-2-enyl-diphosphate synthase
MIQRRKTRQVKVGAVRIGGGAPVSIQSMAKTDTRNVAATIRQIKKLESAGCDIVRVAVLDMAAAKAIKAIKKKIKIPLVADIHFQHKLAIEAIKAGADKIRLNPGNIQRKEDIAEVIKLAKKRKIPIRIGLNSGSLPDVPSPYPLPKGERERVRGMVDATLNYIKLFESLDFHDIIVSLKASDVAVTIDAYRRMAKLCDYPFHLGVTAAGSPECGIIKSSVGLGALLSEGIGDTIRVSLTGEPEAEVRIAREILSSLGLCRKAVDIVSCPTCGRCEVDLVKIVKEVEEKLSQATPQLCSGQASHKSQVNIKPVKIAVMGCVVNGPGEAKDADIGIAAGKGCGMLFRKGKAVRKIKESDFVKVLLDEMDSIVNPNA